MNSNQSAFDVDLSTGPAEMGNEFLTLLDELREYDPVYWNKTAHCWMITRHQDVADAIRLYVNGSNADGQFRFRMAWQTH